MLCPMCGVSVGDSMQLCASCKEKAPPPAPKPQPPTQTSHPDQRGERPASVATSAESRPRSRPATEEFKLEEKEEPIPEPASHFGLKLFAALALIIAGTLILFAVFVLLDKQQNLARASLLSIVCSSALLLLVCWLALLSQVAQVNRALLFAALFFPPIAFTALIYRPRSSLIATILLIGAVTGLVSSTIHFESEYRIWPQEALEKLLPGKHEETTIRSYW